MGVIMDMEFGLRVLRLYLGKYDTRFHNPSNERGITLSFRHPTLIISISYLFNSQEVLLLGQRRFEGPIERLFRVPVAEPMGPEQLQGVIKGILTGNNIA